MKPIILAAAFCILSPLIAMAQPDLAGSWTLKMTPDGMDTFDFNVMLEQDSDTVSIWMQVQDQRLEFQDVSFEGELLTFVLPMHEEGLACSTSMRSESMFVGSCLGPLGESITTLRRTDPSGEKE